MILSLIYLKNCRKNVRNHMISFFLSDLCLCQQIEHQNRKQATELVLLSDMFIYKIDVIYMVCDTWSSTYIDEFQF